MGLDIPFPMWQIALICFFILSQKLGLGLGRTSPKFTWNRDQNQTDRFGHFENVKPSEA